MRTGCQAVAAVVLVTLAAACSAPSPVTLQAETASYRVEVELDAASLGRRKATIRLTDVRSDPVDAERVVVSTEMPRMRMTGPTVVAHKLDVGRYQAADELFTMLGDWTLTIRIEGAGDAEEAMFTIEAEP